MRRSPASGPWRGPPGAFAHLGVHGQEDVAALLLLDDEGTRTLSEGAPLTTDSLNLLQFRAPRVLRAPLSPQELASLASVVDPLIPPDPGWDPVRLARRLLSNDQALRAARLGESLAGSPEGDAIRGLLALRRGERLDGVTALRRAVESDPELREAWVPLTRQQHKNSRVSYSPSAWRAVAYPELATVGTGWRHATSGDWQRLAALDATLAAIPARDPLYPDALRLRALWRIESDDPALGLAAVALLDSLLPISHSLRDATLRVRALAAAGEAGSALQMLIAMLQGLDVSQPGNAGALADIERAFSKLAAGTEYADQRARVSNALAARRLELRGVAPTGP